MSNLTIALDVMGGDNGPLSTLPAARLALAKYPNLNLILCGDESTIQEQISQLNSSYRDRITVKHCTEQVAMGDRPAQVLRGKPDASMRVALELVKNEEAAACVSAGNTGALLVLAHYVLKTLPGIERPALISSLPTDSKHKVFLLDLGANVSCTSEILFQYAVMGSVMAEAVEGIESPRVGLINVGEEEIKGNDQVKQTAQLLSNQENINFVGYIEGNDIFTDKADVVVCDGFVGNVALKACEGIAKVLFSEFKRMSKGNLGNRILAKLSIPLMKRIYSKMNPDQYNGASLIGLRGIVVKSHGNVSPEAFLYAIEEAIREVERQVPSRIKDKIEKFL